LRARHSLDINEGFQWERFTCVWGEVDAVSVQCGTSQLRVIVSHENTSKYIQHWGFQAGDYEECRLLGYKTPVRTSQETHYLSATDSSRLMLCKIWCYHGGDYEVCRLLGCYDVWLL
jgi:hypothetical protein